MRVACAIALSDEERETLERWQRGRGTPARLVTRAKIVLRAAEGMMNKDIARQVGTDRLSVARWRRRFAEKGLAGIAKDAPRSGRRPTRRNRLARKIIERTTQSHPTNATHWTVRTLAKELRVSRAMVHVVRDEHQGLAQRIRHALATYRDAEDLINIGAYVQGSNPEIDSALRLMPGIRTFLQQDLYEFSPFDQIEGLMHKALTTERRDTGGPEPNA